MLLLNISNKVYQFNAYLINELFVTDLILMPKKKKKMLPFLTIRIIMTIRIIIIKIIILK